MKVYVVLLLSIFGALSTEETANTSSYFFQVLEEFRKTVEPYNTECMCKTGVNPELLENLWQHGILPNEPCFKCTIKCWAQQLQIMSPTGVMDLEKYEEIVYGVDTAIAKKCGTIEAVDICQKAYEIGVCAYRIVAGIDPHPDTVTAWNAWQEKK